MQNNHEFFGGLIVGAICTAIFICAYQAGEDLDRQPIECTEAEMVECQSLPPDVSLCETETSRRIVDRLSRLDMIDVAKLEWCARRCTYNCYDGQEWREGPE